MVCALVCIEVSKQALSSMHIDATSLELLPNSLYEHALYAAGTQHMYLNDWLVTHAKMCQVCYNVHPSYTLFS